MNKHQESLSTVGEMPMPTAPPSYDESVAAKQPAFNPQMMQQMPVQGGYPQPSYAPQPTTNFIVAAPAQVVIPIQVGPRPANLQCPQCREHIKTVVSTENQKSAHIAALVLCLIGCYLCCLFPYCMNTFKNVHHKCPNCNAFIGTYKS